MSGWMSYFTGRKDNRQSARDSIVSLRQQLLTLDKREEFLQKKIDEELRKAKANATSNKKRKYLADPVEVDVTCRLLRCVSLPGDIHTDARAAS